MWRLHRGDPLHVVNMKLVSVCKIVRQYFLVVEKLWDCNRTQLHSVFDWDKKGIDCTRSRIWKYCPQRGEVWGTRSSYGAAILNRCYWNTKRDFFLRDSRITFPDCTSHTVLTVIKMTGRHTIYNSFSNSVTTCQLHCNCWFYLVLHDALIIFAVYLMPFGSFSLWNLHCVLSSSPMASPRTNQSKQLPTTNDTNFCDRCITHTYLFTLSRNWNISQRLQPSR